MRILHVVPTYLPAIRYGGPIYSVHGLCAALARLGHEVHVFTTSVDGPRDSDVPHGRPTPLDGVSVWYFRSRVGRRLYYAPALARTLRGEVHRFDVVHLHSVYLWPTAHAARAAAAAGVPYVLSPRGMLVPELIARKSRWAKVLWLRTVEAQSLRRAAAVHVTSRLELEDASRLRLPLPAPFVVPNGVEVPPTGCEERASRWARDIADGPAYVLYLGRIHWKKGLDRAVRAIAGTDMRLILCGNDEEGYRAVLERVIAEVGAGRQVSFVGEVVGDDKWLLLSRCRFAVLPSVHENFGNVVVEAMAVGRPVVVTERVGAAEIVHASGAGLVCRADDAALRESMLQLWNDVSRVERMGQAGYTYVAGHLSWDACARQMAAQYETIRRENSLPIAR